LTILVLRDDRELAWVHNVADPALQGERREPVGRCSLPSGVGGLILIPRVRVGVVLPDVVS